MHSALVNLTTVNKFRTAIIVSQSVSYLILNRIHSVTFGLSAVVAVRRIGSDPAVGRIGADRVVVETGEHLASPRVGTEAAMLALICRLTFDAFNK